MSFWSNVKAHAAQKLTEFSGAPVAAEDLVLPPKPEMGDLAFGCFKVAKTLGTNPAEAAKQIAAKFGQDDHLIAKATADGPFVNITLQPGEFIQRLIQDIETSGAQYAASAEGTGKTLMLEYAQPNTHKEMHVGHLRNLTLGASLVRLLRLAGWKVIPTSYHGDVGSHVAKCLWWMVAQSRSSATGSVTDKKKTESETPSPAMALTDGEVERILSSVPRDQKTGRYLGELYAASTREMEAHEDAKDHVSAILRALEAKDPVWTKLWLETRRWSLVEFSELFDELGVQIERQYLESEVVDEGQKMVDDLLKKGVAKESQGAIVVDLEEKKLGVFLIRKSDGTSLYATKDIPLAYLKQREYPKLDRSIVLVDSRQALYFRQLFETLKMMGYPVATEHVGYEFVTLKSGAMSSREGNVVTYQSFRDELLKKTREETMKRHEDWNEGKVHYAAWALAMAGVKFGMLRQDPEKIFTFELEQALSFEGDTGPYVQYAVVRLGSILKKAGAASAEGIEFSSLTELAEKNLALALARFEDVVRRAAHELSPGMIAQWCVETAQLSNAFYRDVKVNDAPEPVRSARLRLVSAARTVLTQGLDVLGIPVPEEM